MENKWLRDALFSGMSANAFGLGTVLTLGWFWTRVSGCSVLYRGDSIEQIGFADILAVAGANAGEISPPSYVPHSSNSTYFYVVRRVNSCGDEEQSLTATVKVSIGVDGDLMQPRPNGVFGVVAKQIAGGRVQLMWSYCPLGQGSKPVHFNVCQDSGTGQIDYENPVAVVGYAGKKFYTYQSGVLGSGRYLFAIRAENAGGGEDGSSAKAEIEVDTTVPAMVDILDAKAV